MTAETAQQEKKEIAKEIKFPPFLYYFVAFFTGAFSGAFLVHQVTRDNYSLQECFLVHEVVEDEPEILGQTSVSVSDSTSVLTSTPVSENTQETRETQETQKPESTLVNINTASLGELDSLPGIGPAYAQRIVDARPYGSIEEIIRVKGIGPKTLEKIKGLICVE